MSALAARDTVRSLKMSERAIYLLLLLWRQPGGLVTSLAPRPSPGGRSKVRLTAAVKQIVADAIRDEYLSTQNKPMQAVIRTVRERCRVAGISSSAANTVRAHIFRLRADKAARAREPELCNTVRDKNDDCVKVVLRPNG